MKILETERLIIETASENDSEFFLELLNSPNWIEYIGDFGIKSIEEAQNYIQTRLIQSYQENGFGLYKMSLKNKTPIGICGFVKREYLDSADIGFAILPKYETKGYTYEACSTLMEYGKIKLKFDPILSITTIGNIKSCRLLNKIGLYEIGTVSPNNDVNKLLLFSNHNQ